MPHFYKYQAAGNDFILADNRSGKLSFSNEQIAQLCDRRFGIGADGLIFIETDPLDFRMRYFNADGSQSFCGNGCRAAVHLAHRLGIIKSTTRFSAHDGTHEGKLLSDGQILVTLRDVDSITEHGADNYFINTGTEHHVRIVENLEHYPVVTEGRAVRYSDLYAPRGTNANFLTVIDTHTVAFRIYERGVEDETYSSGSGATACALVAAFVKGLSSPITVRARGGTLNVSFQYNSGKFTQVAVAGPVSLVFETDLDSSIQP